MGRKSKAKMNRLQNKFKILEFPDGNYIELDGKEPQVSSHEEPMRPKTMSRSCRFSAEDL